MPGGIAGIIKEKVISDGTCSKIGNAIVGTSEDVLASYVVEQVSNSGYGYMFGNELCDDI